MPRQTPEIPSASMADIAFLLLTFFLVTTHVANIKGLSVLLPPSRETSSPRVVHVLERNLFKVQVNSSDHVIVEGKLWEASENELSSRVKEFILNNGKDPSSSENPQKAVVSYKTDRGTSYRKFIAVLDAIQAAYYDIYAERAGVSNARWREIASDPNRSAEFKRLFELGKKDMPMNLSIAEPTKKGG